MRVLIADDHEAVRKGVRSLLRTQPQFDICGEAVDGRDAVEKAKLLHPDLVLMDISMPNLNGLEATREIRNTFPEIEVIILSQYETAQMAEQAFHVGARGYVVKSSIGKSLFTALEHVSRHESFLDPCIIWIPDQADPEVELALERSRFCSAIVNSSDDAIISKDLSGLITSWNRSAERIFGFTAAEAIGRPITMIIPPELHEQEAKILERLMLGERIDHYESVRITKGKDKRNVSLSISPIRDSTSRIAGASIIACDITKREPSGLPVG